MAGRPADRRRDLDQHVGPVDDLGQLLGLRDRSRRCRAASRGSTSIDTRPSTPSVEVEDRREQVAGVAHVVGGRGPDHVVDVGALGGQLGHLLLVGRAVGERALEDASGWWSPRRCAWSSISSARLPLCSRWRDRSSSHSDTPAADRSARGSDMDASSCWCWSVAGIRDRQVGVGLDLGQCEWCPRDTVSTRVGRGRAIPWPRRRSASGGEAELPEQGRGVRGRTVVLERDRAALAADPAPPRLRDAGLDRHPCGDRRRAAPTRCRPGPAPRTSPGTASRPPGCRCPRPAGCPARRPRAAARSPCR